MKKKKKLPPLEVFMPKLSQEVRAEIEKAKQAGEGLVAFPPDVDRRLNEAMKRHGAGFQRIFAEFGKRCYYGR